MDSDNERLEEIAHRIWEQEGCPDGQHERHWAMAEEALAAEKAQKGSVTATKTGAQPSTANDI